LQLHPAVHRWAGVWLPHPAAAPRGDGVNPSLLEARRLAVTQGRRETLAPRDLRLARAEIPGLYGPHGAGKSTAVQALACLHPRATGEVRVDGKLVGSDLPLLEFRRRTAVVFQDVLLLRGSVLDNVVLGLKLRGIPRDQRERRAQGWLE